MVGPAICYVSNSRSDGSFSGAERSVWDAEDHVQPATASDFDEVHFLGP